MHEILVANQTPVPGDSKGDLGRGTDRACQPRLALTPHIEDDVMLETTKRPERKVRLDIVGGLEISEVSAELASIVPGRQVDDNAHIMLRFNC